MNQQFSENEEPSSAVPTPGPIDRMTAEEAREVIDLWLVRRADPASYGDRPSVRDLAEGLDIAVEQAQALLGEVRQRRQAQEIPKPILTEHQISDAETEIGNAIEAGRMAYRFKHGTLERRLMEQMREASNLLIELERERSQRLYEKAIERGVIAAVALACFFLWLVLLLMR